MTGEHEPALDSEGFPVGAVDHFDEWCNVDSEGCALYCGTCSDLLATHSPSDHGFCNCGDGCEDGQCESCGDFEGEHDEEDEPAYGCTCDSCSYEYDPTTDKAPEPEPASDTGPAAEDATPEASAFAAAADDIVFVGTMQEWLDILEAGEEVAS